MTDEETVQGFIEYCESPLGKAVIDREANYIKDQLENPGCVLEVGCGIGALTDRLSAPVIGLDISQAMVDAAARRTDGQYIRGDAHQLPFGDASFDAVVSVTTLEFVSDYAQALAEIERVVAPAGNITILMLNQESRYFTRRAADEESYFALAQHKPATVEAKLQDSIDLTAEYFLGIDETEVFETTDPEWAAIRAFSGTVPASE